jgi:hypothetical protein
LLNYANYPRKKLISTLIYFNSFFNLLPTQSPRNRWDRAPLTCPSSRASYLVPPPLCLHIFSWLLRKIVVQRPSKALNRYVYFIFLSPHSPPQTT